MLEQVEPDGGWGDTDGTFTGRERGEVRVGGTVSINLTMFADMSADERLATITHELGHALGLVHRLDRRSLMNAVTGPRTRTAPDEVDFHNLRVIYGLAIKTEAIR